MQQGGETRPFLHLVFLRHSFVPHTGLDKSLKVGFVDLKRQAQNCQRRWVFGNSRGSQDSPVASYSLPWIAILLLYPNKLIFIYLFILACLNFELASLFRWQSLVSEVGAEGRLPKDKDTRHGALCARCFRESPLGFWASSLWLRSPTLTGTCLNISFVRFKGFSFLVFFFLVRSALSFGIITLEFLRTKIKNSISGHGWSK